MHTYPKEGGGAAFRAPGSPVLTNASAYGMVGPIIIGEVSTRNRRADSKAGWACAAYCRIGTPLLSRQTADQLLVGDVPAACSRLDDAPAACPLVLWLAGRVEWPEGVTEV